MKSTIFALTAGLSLALASAPSMASHNSEESLLQRIAAVGSLNILTADEVAAAAEQQAAEQPIQLAAGDIDGEAVYNGICTACHTPGVAGSPKLGDAAAWADRIAQGMDVMVGNAVKGFQGKVGVMPPKGGNPGLSDEEIAAAVQYMVDKSQ
jgi:cytochrome c5